MAIRNPDYNRLYTARLYQYGLQPGDRVHIGIVGPGQQSDDAVLTGLFEHKDDPTIIVGIRITIGDRVIPDLWWGNLIELWKLNGRGQKVSDDIMAAL